ncbi:delta-lactam-biosynthetic de-N-acetylase [Oceanobacillus alkalisoli]|uniref:delta-lactam-biosynthetic de-N-acetylase n=1 Tax=Oceanobacillus alkalisoli TaxID=2925113 RepID=UPI001EF0BFB3|nr:delta-lactam-biosynthetic de-N-acetylase [Oceanobacillus alkalisoli]MCF3943628.1 delta-lactam-biosynthetic de-N-acetylase [Oceanobacillus alkalisoli]MCG5104975.1 delta-lactam-biosynthetic de-N-acetylase [Oceanobacillus alkalisoli]
MKRLLGYCFVFVLIIGFSLETEVDARGFGWGYKKGSAGEIPEIGSYGDLLQEYGAYFADSSGGKHIYLTFDNGYEEGYTPQILDVLKKENVPATFFVTGHYVETAPDLVKRMVDEGHIIGNHSYHHPDFSILTKDAMRQELEDLEKKVSEVSDQKDLKYLRPPRGIFNEQTLEWANELGYIHIFWSLAFKDWETSNQKGWRYAYEEVMEKIHPGAIVLLHTVSKDNAEALAVLITDLKEEGYQFKSLDDLILRDQIPEVIYGY